MTHSRFLKKAAQKLDRLSLTKNYPEYIKCLISVRDSCQATIDKYNKSIGVQEVPHNYRENTDDVVVKDDGD